MPRREQYIWRDSGGTSTAQVHTKKWDVRSGPSIYASSGTSTAQVHTKKWDVRSRPSIYASGGTSTAQVHRSAEMSTGKARTNHKEEEAASKYGAASFR